MRSNIFQNAFQKSLQMRIFIKKFYHHKNVFVDNTTKLKILKNKNEFEMFGQQILNHRSILEMQWHRGKEILTTGNINK